MTIRMTASMLAILLFTIADIGAVGNGTPRGPHHTRVEQVTERSGPFGVSLVTNRFEAIATGLNRLENGQWVPAREVIEILGPDNTPVARQTQHEVIFPNTLNSEPLDVSLSDGRFQSLLTGVYLYDTASGQSVQIGQVRPVPAVLIQPNQLAYLDAIEGSIKADIYYVLTKDGLSQNIVIRENSIDLATYGWQSRNVLIEVASEIVSAPALTKRVNTLASPAAGVPAMIDETISFGQFSIGGGKAFHADNGANIVSPGADAVPVAKSWSQPDPNAPTHLIESASYHCLAPYLEALPKGPSCSGKEAAATRRSQERPRAEARPEIS